MLFRMVPHWTPLLFFIFIVVAENPEKQNKALILILLDGFRWDYFQISGLKGFPRIINSGVKAEYMETLYPSESYPGYYSVVTGRHAESHGMVLNYMYDEEQNIFFKMETDENARKPLWWEDAEPLWITTTRNNIATGLYLFPGGDVVIHGIKPLYVKPYSHISGVENFRQDLDSALTSIQNNEIQYAQVYCEYPDEIGHAFGPHSFQLNNSIVEVDSVIDNFIDKIIEKNLHNTVHLIIVSDHGMTKTDLAKKIYLNSTVNPNDIHVVLDRGSHFGIYPVKGQLEKVYNDLLKLEGITVYKKENIPEQYHFKNHKRVPPLYAVVHKGYFLIGLPDKEKQVPLDTSDKIWFGFHGYDPKEADMNAIFLAWGASFKKNYATPKIHITDPYNLMAYILNITSLPNNGSWSRVEDMLQENSSGNILDFHHDPSLNSPIGAANDIISHYIDDCIFMLLLIYSFLMYFF